MRIIIEIIRYLYVIENQMDELMKCCRRSSFEWRSQSGMSRRLSGTAPGNFSGRVGGLGGGLAESDAGMQSYQAPMSQPFAALDFDLQVSVSQVEFDLVIIDALDLIHVVSVILQPRVTLVCELNRMLRVVNTRRTSSTLKSSIDYTLVL